MPEPFDKKWHFNYVVIHTRQHYIKVVTERNGRLLKILIGKLAIFTFNEKLKIKQVCNKKKLVARINKRN